MRLAEDRDRERILKFLRPDLPNCIYLYIDIANYGISTDNIKVWIDEKNSDVSLVLMKYYDSIQLYSSNKDCNIDPVVCILKQHPVAMISGERSVVEKLASYCPQYHPTYGEVFLMDRYRKVVPDMEIQEAEPEDTKEIAELICQDKEIGGHYTTQILAKQLEERIRTHTGRSYIIRENGVIIAHTATYAEADGIAVVGGTIVHDAFRNTNAYMIVSNYMLEQLAIEGKKAYTFSISPKMIKYHGLVHTKCGEYGKLTKADSV